jgi:hypothetical protein
METGLPATRPSSCRTGKGMRLSSVRRAIRTCGHARTEPRSARAATPLSPSICAARSSATGPTVRSHSASSKRTTPLNGGLLSKPIGLASPGTMGVAHSNRRRKPSVIVQIAHRVDRGDLRQGRQRDRGGEPRQPRDCRKREVHNREVAERSYRIGRRRGRSWDIDVRNWRRDWQLLRHAYLTSSRRQTCCPHQFAQLVRRLPALPGLAVGPGRRCCQQC